FWSWQMDVSPDERWVASVTGQYLAGGYKYEPAPEKEPSLKVFDTQTGELRWEFSHLPPVLSVAFSPDNQFVAAANMMGDIRIWNLDTGQLAASWNTPDFTSWGIIKSHHYIGGIFALSFSPDSREILAAGMGAMNDPMAGNGKQTWQRFAWTESPPRKTSQIKDGENGNGLMEALQFHPSGRFFLMAGRLAQGKWNAGLFAAEGGQLLHSADTKMRVVDAAFLKDGTQVLLAGAGSQEKKKNGVPPDFGKLKLYRCIS
ncbi:MAG TPA: WD40 repeat domain-containing protein, partial [Verrucomicrobiae bacterium]|nr:WD40 repeat domain-containing protein [Verrucomicrobiae bacterium]